MARISVFKGREARLNKTIFWTLAIKGSQSVYDIWRELRAQRDFKYIRYHVVNRRVRALEDHGYIERIGQRIARTGLIAILYQLTSRAYLAILLDKIDLDDFIEKAPEGGILNVLGGLATLRLDTES
jgi:DNA-binding PadR family transcriptional regulator